MTTDGFLQQRLGDEPALLAEGRKPPDRREISLRWLSGTFMTAITSSLLMGVALFGALEGREQLALPAEALASTDIEGLSGRNAEKGSRLVQSAIAAKVTDREIMEVSTMVRDGDRDVVRKQPFAHVRMLLAAAEPPAKKYPAFDPLAIFATEDVETVASVRTGQIYGADVDSEISLRTLDFPLEAPGRPYAATMSLEEAEETVRTNGSVLTDGTIQLASLNYVDPRRFASNSFELDLTISPNANVVAENVSVAAMEPDFFHQSSEFVDDVIPARKPAPITDVLTGAGYQGDQVNEALAALRSLTGLAEVEELSAVRLGAMQRGPETEIVRLSIYEKGRHLGTVARTDSGIFVRGSEPPSTPAIASAFEQAPVALPAGRTPPTIYDGIYRAGLGYDMPLDMIGQVIHLLASNVDFKAKLQPSDTLQAFFSVDDAKGTASDESELLFLDAKFGSSHVRLYRFQHPEDNSIDYYDPEGRSAKLFLLRTPVPTGKFRSGFGMRRHPILKYNRMHSGVDWSAPRGTPILAAGNGKVIKAGWDSGGYGKQTLIQHPNGYVTSYNHQSRIAKGVKPGATVRQGQVIGFVGSTGLSTGPHLHYELHVNGRKVDPMRVRLPDGKVLDGEALASFKRERQRIDSLLGIDAEDTKLASR
ncbi:M23 family metallopeptidase [Pseudohoeflea coraliihabitans]|uniref:M23 family metallopeptidase n=1 Tax=Pseudohoeflea coraliihabitans TaxID=2860393 RepID=A0ABS6WM15_9HYPH|nr:M23 family metallopeptidase [Pseudohoeflea sp. DP4N28-3]MBW3096462.1 M23 family metallopeptidase [Pseudohoeflea sp. DP4N28-3]